MKYLLIVLLALAAAIGAAGLIGADTGYLIVSIADWTVRASVTFALLILFLLFVIMYLIMHAQFSLKTLQSKLRQHKQKRQLQKVETTLVTGLSSMLEGNWKLAEKAFIKGAKSSQKPFLNYLFAARAAQQQKAYDRLDNYMRLAYQHQSDNETIVGVTQAELQLNDGKTEQALATLKRLDNKDKGMMGVKIKQLLINTHSQIGDWQTVLQLADELERSQRKLPEPLFNKRLTAHAGLLQNTPDSNALEQIWQSIPTKLQRDHYLLDTYVRERLRLKDTIGCDKLLLNAIKKNWDGALVRLYGLIHTKDKLKQLRNAEKLLAGHQQDPLLLLTLGRLSAVNQLWGKAKKYLQCSLDSKQNPEAYYELAAIYSHEQEHDMAKLYYKKGLEMVVDIDGAQQALSKPADIALPAKLI